MSHSPISSAPVFPTRAVCGRTFWNSLQLIALHPLRCLDAEERQRVRKRLLRRAAQRQTRERQLLVRRHDPALGVEPVELPRELFGVLRNTIRGALVRGDEN